MNEGLKMDPSTEKVLKCLIEHCDNKESGHVNYKNTFFPVDLQKKLDYSLEKLARSGMLDNAKRWRSGGLVYLFPEAFEYFRKKEKFMLNKTQSEPTQVNYYYGNTNVIGSEVKSSTIIAGSNNTVSSGKSDMNCTSATGEVLPQVTNGKNTVFISHRSVNKAIADILLDFFVGTGVPREAVFCSSLPGNDVNEKISEEIKSALHSSVVNIVILSKDYYESAYCLNEAGILWFLDDTVVIPIALPEITYDKMVGFLNDDYKIRKLDCEDDIAYILDTVAEKLQIELPKIAIIQEATQKLKNNYNSII